MLTLPRRTARGALPGGLWRALGIGGGLGIGLFLAALVGWPGDQPVARPPVWFAMSDVALRPVDYGADGRAFFWTDQPVTATFAVRNTSAQSRLPPPVAVGVRRPTNCADPWNARPWDFPPGTPTAPVPSGGAYLYERSQSFPAPGLYFMEPLIQTPDGTWGGLAPSPRLWVTIRDAVHPAQWPPRGCLTPLSLP